MPVVIIESSYKDLFYSAYIILPWFEFSYPNLVYFITSTIYNVAALLELVNDKVM